MLTRLVKLTHYRTQHRFGLGSAECFSRGGPAEYSTRALVEFRGDSVELVLSERGQVGVLVQILAQQSVRVLVGAALPWVVVMSRDIADSFRQDIADTSVVGRAGFRCLGIGGWCRW